MRIFMTGGTGFVGRTLIARFTAGGHEVTVLTRRARGAGELPAGARYLEGNPMEEGPWQGHAAEHEVLVNLAGASIFTRWTRSAREVIRDSRIQSTTHLVDALSSRKGQRTLLLSTSAVGYYGFCGDEQLDEKSAPGDDFLASVTRDWEAAALGAEAHGVRVALLRFGIVLGRNGGALKQMAPAFRRCLGSPLGSGTQWFSWIHEEDLASIFLFLMERQDIAGPINSTAPNPVTNREMTRILGKVLNRPTFLPAVPGFVLRALLGEFGAMLLKGQRVLPRRLQEAGFRFRFPEMAPALKDLLR